MYISENEVRAALTYEALIPAIREALTDYSAGKVVQPPRMIMRAGIADDHRDGWFAVMPVIHGDAMAVKTVTFYRRNAELGIHTHMAIVELLNRATGEPLAVMDGRLITEMRTAAVSAAVTNRLAAPDSRVLALLGSGVQARAHLEALAHVRAFDEVRVWSRTPAHAQRFAAEHGARAMDAEAAVRGADVVVTATAAVEPILRGAWLKPGAHVNAIGAPLPTWRELDDEAMAKVLVVDSREAVLHESGDVILSGAPIYAEAGEIFAGTKPAPVGATTVFKSVGLAVEDIAAAKLVFDRRSERQ